MIRIDILSLTPEKAVMRIAGWVQNEGDIELIAQEGNHCLLQSRLLVLDLEHLQQLHDFALPLLKGWQAEGRLQIRSWHYETGIKLRREGLIPQRGEPAMMHIEVRSQTAQEVVLRLEGWVQEAALVRVLREEVECWLEQGQRVVLELEGLKALSPAGLALVHSWQGRPVELRRMPVFIGSLIELLYGPQGLQMAPAGGGQP